jgi:hypothetical protein
VVDVGVVLEKTILESLSTRERASVGVQVCGRLGAKGRVRAPWARAFYKERDRARVRRHSRRAGHVHWHLFSHIGSLEYKG